MNSEAVCSRVNQIIPHIKHTFAVLRLNTEHMGDTIAIRQGSFKRADLCQHLLADRLNNKAGPDRFGGVELVENRDVVSLIGQQTCRGQPTHSGPYNGDAHEVWSFDLVLVKRIRLARTPPQGLFLSLAHFTAGAGGPISSL